MTDRELLELAAKAAGIEGIYRVNGYRNISGISKNMDDDLWNPLLDDGEVFRLSTALDLNVFHTSGNTYALPSDDNGIGEQCVSYRDAGDKLAATRRAIVIVAAEIGKEME